jgi:glycosyltransferase involved in cell wall biosynthesis
MKPLFSVLVSNYNNAPFIEECINSALKQTYENIEIIFVDDCSTDNSLEIIEKLAIKDKRIKILKNSKNEGAGFTKKRMIDESSGQFCGILDSDDFLNTNAIEKLVNNHLENPKASIVYTSTIYFDESGDISKNYKKTIAQPKDISVIEVNNVSHFVTFKKEMYKKTIGVNPLFKKAVDLDFYILMEEVGEILHFDELLYHHRIHDKGISQGNAKELAYDWDFIIKNYHLVRKGISPLEHYQKQKKWYKYDLSVYSNFTLFKILMNRYFKFKK